ncbi:TonB-dependent receptor SusC, partial [termite gut metagenome]
YNKTIEKHALNALLVYTMRQEKQGLSDNLQLSLPKRNMGLSGRLAYNYDSRYFIESDFGYNGSERFAKEKRFGFFPAIAGGWMLSNESFFPLKDLFSTFKLKATYGLVGSDAIGSGNDRFYYLSQVDMNVTDRPVNWGSLMGYNPGAINVSRYANADIGWETSYKSNIGVEFATTSGLTGNVEVYHERRENIL